MRWQGLITGMHWRRPPRACPPWCAGDHRCTAQHGYPAGEHRSADITVRMPYAAIVCTRVERIDGAAWLEARIRVGLPAGEAAAGRTAVLVMDEVDRAIRDAVWAATGGWVDMEPLPALTSMGG